jgi:hypothetical protein
MNLKCGVAPDVDGGAMVECHDNHRHAMLDGPEALGAQKIVPCLMGPRFLEA